MAEYAILLAVALSAVIGVQVLMRRGLQGRLKESSDFVVAAINEKAGTDCSGQYEPGYRNIERDITQRDSQRQSLSGGGRERREYLEGYTQVIQKEVVNETRKTK